MRKQARWLAGLLAGGMLITCMPGALADGGVLFAHDDFSAKPTAAQLAEMGWKGNPAENGKLDASSGQLIMARTKAIDAPSSSFNAERTLRVDEKTFEEGNTREAIWTNKLKGQYDIEMKMKFAPISGADVWVNFVGGAISASNAIVHNQVGRYKVKSSGEFCVYNNKLNASTSDLVMYKGAGTSKSVRAAFNTETSKYQIFLDGSTTPAKTTVSGAKTPDTFPMTGYSAQTAQYIDMIQFNINSKMTKDKAFATLDYVKVTEVQRARDEVVDGALDALTLESICATPENAGEISQLPQTMGTATLAWESDHPEIIDTDGTVVRPQQETDVILHAEVTNPATSFSKHKAFRLSVKPQADQPEPTEPPEPGEERIWENVKTVAFDSAQSTEEYTVEIQAPALVGASVEEGGLTFKKIKTDELVAGKRPVVKANFADAIADADQYYVELTYTSDMKAGESRVIFQNAAAGEAALYCFSDANTITVAGKNKAGVRDFWRTQVPMSQKHGQQETVGLQYNKADNSYYFCKDRKRASADRYFNSYGTGLEGLQMEWQAVKGGVDSTFALKEYNVWVYHPELQEKLDADIASVTAASMSQEAADAVTENLTVPAGPLANGTTVSWKSSLPEVIGIDGTVTRQQEDKEVTLSATFQNYGQSVEKQFVFTVLADERYAGFAEDVASVTLQSLTSQPPSAVTENLTVPGSPLPNGTTVLWQSSLPEVVGVDGTVTRQQNDVEVTLSATFTSVGGLLEEEKTFSFTVLGTAAAEGYLVADQDNFTGGDLSRIHIDSQAGGSITGDGNALTMKRTSGSGELQATKYFVTADPENPYGVCGEEVTVEFDMTASDALAESMNLINDSGGNKITSFQVKKGTGFLFSYVEENVPGRDFGWGNGLMSVSIPYQYGKKIHAAFTVNVKTQELRVFVDGVELGADITKYTRNEVKDVGSLMLSSAAKDSGSTVIYDNIVLKSALGGVSRETAMAQNDLHNLTFSALSDELQQSVTQTLRLPDAGVMGSVIGWSASPEGVIDPATGAVTRTAQRQDVKLTAAARVGSGNAEKTFDLTVEKISAGNLLTGKTGASNARAAEGHEAFQAVDQRYGTYWFTAGREKTPYLQVNLGEETRLAGAALYEVPDGGVYTIQKAVVETSDDGKTWTQVAQLDGIGEYKQVDFLPCMAKYLRLRVTEKAAGNTGLYEFEAYYQPADGKVVEADAKTFRLDAPYALTENLVLPKEAAFGSAIRWQTSNAAVLSAEGALTRPKQDTAVTLRAVFEKGGASAPVDYHFMVAGTEQRPSSPGGGGASGGGSRGGSSSGPAAAVPIVPNVPGSQPDPRPQPQQGTFTDVSAQDWSYPYIAELARDGILEGSGDGSFRPQAAMTREEVLKVLLSALEIQPAAAAGSEFTDVPADAWYAGYIAAAQDLGIVQGMDGGRFGVGQTVSRQDLAAMAGRALEIKGLQLSGTQTAAFADSSEIDSYARGSVALLAAAGVISGTDGKFLPQDAVTREAAAKILCLLRRQVKGDA